MSSEAIVISKSMVAVAEHDKQRTDENALGTFYSLANRDAQTVAQRIPIG
jgi:hypothetical protein